MRGFLADTEAVQFQPTLPSTDRYLMIEAVLKRFSYLRLKRTEKGVVLRYLARVPVTHANNSRGWSGAMARRNT